MPADGFEAPTKIRNFELRQDGRARRYALHCPYNWDGEALLPVVLVFHGGGSHADSMIAMSGMNAKADEAGFLAVYPSGTGPLPNRVHTWNGGSCCGYAARHDVDDVGFVSAMIDDLARRFPIDERRVYATGMSNGAMMAYRLAAELSDRIAAIAPVGAAMGLTEPKPVRPVPVLHVHGTADENAPYRGGQGENTRSQTVHMAVTTCIERWVALNDCRPKAERSWLEDRDPNDHTRTRRDRYPPRPGGAEVILLLVVGGGHTWPGHLPVRSNAPEWVKNSALIRGFGRSSKDFDVNDEIWAFFQRHTLPTVLEQPEEARRDEES